MASLENSADMRRQFVDEAFLNHNLREAMREAAIRSFIISGEDEASPIPADTSGQNAHRRNYFITLCSGLAAAVLIAVALWIPRRAANDGTPSATLPNAAAVAGQPATKQVKARA